MYKIEFWRLYNRKTYLIIKRRNLLLAIVLLLIIECNVMAGIIFTGNAKYMILCITFMLIAFYLPLLILHLYSLFLHNKKEIEDITAKHNTHNTGDEKINM